MREENRDSKARVFFVGAGPGDPELLTVKAARLIREAEILMFHGSLVSKEVVALAGKAEIMHDCSLSDLEEQRKYYHQAQAGGRLLVRIHSGDPAIFGTLREQTDYLDKEGISYEIVPGVSSFLAAAAALGCELTVPGVSQTVIITRAEGRTPVPDKEQLASLAAHQATMAIFLSAQLVEKVQSELLLHYDPATPAAIVADASRETQRTFRCKLEGLAKTAKENGVSKTALIIVGDVLEAQGKLSLLYDPAFSHEYRQGR